MAFAGIGSAKDRSDLISYLKGGWKTLYIKLSSGAAWVIRWNYADLAVEPSEKISNTTSEASSIIKTENLSHLA